MQKSYKAYDHHLEGCLALNSSVSRWLTAQGFLRRPRRRCKGEYFQLYNFQPHPPLNSPHLQPGIEGGERVRWSACFFYFPIFSLLKLNICASVDLFQLALPQKHKLWS